MHIYLISLIYIFDIKYENNQFNQQKSSLITAVILG